MNILGLIDIPTFAVFALIAAALLVAHTRWKFSYWRKQGVPTPTPWPIIGNATFMFSRKQLHEIQFENYQKYGKTFGMYEPTNNTLVVSDPEDLKAIYVKDFDVFTNRRDIDFGEDPIFSNFLSVVTNEKWNFIRNVVSPTFSGAKLKRMTERLVGCCEQLRDCLEKISKDGKEIDAKRIFGAYTLDVIASTAFRIKLNTMEDPDNIFVKHAKAVFQPKFNWRFFAYALFPKLVSKLGIIFVDPDALNCVSAVVKKILSKCEDENQQYNDFLSLMKESMKENEKSENLKNGSDTKKSKMVMTDDMVISQCVLFFFAGYDTTASTLAMSAYNLAYYPDCQDKLLDEIDATVKKYGNITYEAVGDMPYLSAVVKETLRLYTPAVFGDRKAGKDYQLGDIFLKKGTVVIIPIYSIHHDPENWPEPEKFDPERFMCDPSEIDPFKYLPFGAGRRSCVATRFALLEVKMALAIILMKFKFVKCSKSKYPPKLVGIPVLQPRDIFLGIEPRTK